MMDFSRIKEIIADEANALGVKEYEIYASDGAEVSVSTLNAEVNAFSSGASSGVCIRVSDNGRIGYASSELIEDAEMRELLKRALANAKATEKLGGVGIYSGSDRYEALPKSNYAKKDTRLLRRIAKETADAVYAESERVQDGTETTALTSSYSIRIANSHGLSLECSGGIDALVASAVIAEGDSFESSHEISLLDENTNIADVAKSAVENAEKKLGAALVPSGKYSVVISGKCMRSILAVFSSAFSAKNAQMGLSLLAGKEGEKIASDILHITDDPMREGVPVKTNFDAEGYAASRKDVVKDGVLLTLLHNRETALLAGRESTGNASKSAYYSPVSVSPYAFCIEAGDLTQDELYARTGEGILITEVKGLHAGANAVTGDFSIESAGFMIREGRIAEAVKSFTIAGNFFELIKSVAALSDKVEVSITSSFTTFGSPDVLITDIMVAGK